MKKEEKPFVIDDLNGVAPEFVKLTKKSLFGDIWKRQPLGARDKSLVTITTLAALNRVEQIDAHLRIGLDNGLTKEEIVCAYPRCVLRRLARSDDRPYTLQKGFRRAKRDTKKVKSDKNITNELYRDAVCV